MPVAADRHSLRDVEDERPAPVLTITDPGRPAPLTDVLQVGVERDPWRPGPRLRRALLAGLPLLAAAVALVAYVGQRSAEHAAVRRELARVAVVADDAGFSAFVFRNAGPDAVTVLTARVDGAGNRTSPVAQPISPGDTLLIPLRVDAPCPARVPQTGPAGVQLEVRTDRGSRRAVHVDLSDTQTSFALLDGVRDRCRLFDEADSFEVERAGAGTEGRSMVVFADVSNRSVLARAITGLSAGPGFRVVPLTALPLDVRTRVHVAARVTVSDCAQALQTTGPIASGRFDGSYTGGLQATVNGHAFSAPAVLFVGATYDLALHDLVETSC